MLSHTEASSPFSESISAQSAFYTKISYPLGLCRLGSQMRQEVRKELKTKCVLSNPTERYLWWVPAESALCLHP